MINTRVGGIRTKDDNFVEKTIAKTINRFMADAFDIVKSETPIDTGNARRNWRKKNKGRKVENRVPYIARLNEGHSKQARDGIAEPAIEKLNNNFKKGKYTK
tara:strand:+ start:2846 stop:3151 length:306 start_codon:yes stop_codon:yes gene_type:complete